MSKKTLANIFAFLRHAAAERLVIESRPEAVLLDYHFAGGDRQRFSLPKRLEDNLRTDLNTLLKIAPGELTARKYCQIADKNGSTAFYLTILPGEHGERIIINPIKKDLRPRGLKQLGFNQADLKTVLAATRARAGLILVSGPEQSGKSTTFFTLLKELNRPELNVCFLSRTGRRLPNIDGLNLLARTKTNWEKVLSHDVEVIAADDLDDPADLIFAIRAAVSGRLVLGEVTASSAAETLQQIRRLPLPEKFKQAGLRLIINQRLAALKRPAKSRNPRQAIGVFSLLAPSSGRQKL